MSSSRLAIVLAIVALAGGTTSVQAAAPRTGDRPAPVPTVRQHIVSPTDQIAKPRSTQRPAAGTAAASTSAGVAPFLTRPYWNYHAVTSIFDHCNPDYSHDGRICEDDGTVATSANGVDPFFNAGYAITPGGGNYLYYDGHNGWDLALNYETLLAAADGIVNLAGCDPFNGGCGAGFGLTVTIDHPNGFTTRYGHMSQIWVSPGQQVVRGQAIGVSGNTGASTGPHLHFGVYITSSWTAIDPWGWDGNYPDPWPSDQGNLWITGNPQNPVPWAPQNVTANPGGNAATVSWLAPAFDGGSGVTSYSVTSSPGGIVTTVPGTQTSAVVSGLTNGTAYTFTVTASNGNGTSPDSVPSNQVVPTATVSIVNPATSGTTDFTVSWSASNTNSFDVAYSEDAGPNLKWLTATTATSGHFYGLAGHSYRFQVSAHTNSGISVATSGTTAVAAGATTPFGFKAAYSVDQFGAVHTIGSRPLSSAPIWNWDIGRAITVLANGDGGYILDGWGGVHAFGNAGDPRWSAYWPGWDIARDIAVLPDGSGGYVLDGWGGIHPFAAAGHPMPPDVSWSAYWPGWDIARRLVVNPDGKTG